MKIGELTLSELRLRLRESELTLTQEQLKAEQAVTTDPLRLTALGCLVDQAIRRADEYSMVIGWAETQADGGGSYAD
jgi:hypothetical protein